MHINRVCIHCNEEKLVEEFSKRFRQYTSVCKKCRRTRESAKVLKDNEKVRSQLEEQGFSLEDENVGSYRAKAWRLQTKYDLDYSAYLVMKHEQKGKCAICKTRDAVCVDHCHTTGKVRELLCHSCNTGLGNFKDNVGFLLEAAEYLKRYRE